MQTFYNDSGNILAMIFFYLPLKISCLQTENNTLKTIHCIKYLKMHGEVITEQKFESFNFFMTEAVII